MNDNNLHWYLCMIDVLECEVVLLDSMPLTDNNRRLIDVKKVVSYLDSILQCIDCLYKPILHTFPLVEAAWAPRQENGHDCGMFVIKFMEEPLLGPGWIVKVIQHLDSYVALTSPIIVFHTLTAPFFVVRMIRMICTRS